MVMDSLAILILAGTAITGKSFLGFLLILSAVRFLLSACVQFGAGQAVNVTAGAVGLLLGAVAIYGGLALLLEDFHQNTILPLGAGAASMPWKGVCKSSSSGPRKRRAYGSSFRATSTAGLLRLPDSLPAMPDIRDF